MCKQCFTTLNEHIKYKENLITNQRKLYSHVDSHNFVSIDIKEESVKVYETSPEFNFVEMLAVKPESDDDNRHQDSENGFELKVETQPVEDKIPGAINVVTSGQQILQGALTKLQISRRTLTRKIKQGSHTRKLMRKTIISDKAGKKTDLVPLSASLQAPQPRTQSSPQNSLEAIDEIFHVCDLCGFETLTKNNLAYHMMNHLDRQDFSRVTCSMCQKVFLTKNIRMIHEKHHCKTSKGDFSCETCGMNFTSKLHMINHHKSDHRKIDLYVHAKTHDGGGQKTSDKVNGEKSVKVIAHKKHLTTYHKRRKVDPEARKKKTCKYCSIQIAKHELNRHVSSF